jgi:hypothetical protein
MLKIFFLSGVFLLIIVSCGPARKMPSFGYDPLSVHVLDAESLSIFSALPLEGKVEASEKFWSGDHWPSARGGINRRWQEDFGRSNAFLLDELRQLSREELARLSPSEKYDILMGRYDYPLKQEVAARNKLASEEWEGIGEGWAMATSYHAEPGPKDIENADGIVVPFGSSDIKALLSYYYAAHHKVTVVSQLGKRCFGRDEGQKWPYECSEDFDAGQFHIVLGNRLGLKGMSFVMDVERFKEVWNHPVVSYQTEVLAENPPTREAPAGTVKTLSLKTAVGYVDLSYTISWERVRGSWNQLITRRSYFYDLHLNKKGVIISGTWRMSDRPDFVWVIPKVRQFSGYMSQLESLL